MFGLHISSPATLMRDRLLAITADASIHNNVHLNEKELF